MNIKAIMKPVTRWLSSSDSLQTAHQLLLEEGVKGLPVCQQDGSLVGVVTARDLVKAIARAPDSAPKVPVSDIMLRNDISCREDDPVLPIAINLKQQGRSYLVVLDERGQLQGAVDLLPYQNYYDRDRALDEALDETFPASDPISPP